MKKILFSLTFAIGALVFTSCEKEAPLTENPNFNINATGDNPNPPVSGTDTTSTGNPLTDLVVTPRQRATVTYVGATWCPPCGAYGDPTKIHMESTHGADVVILNVQSNDAISTSAEFGPRFGNAFQTFVGSNSIPHAYWSGANYAMVHRGFYVSAASNNTAADMDITSIVSDNADVGVAAKASLSNNEINVEALVKFYKAASNYYIGVYVLEDGVDALQQISGAPAAITSHENVLRGAANASSTLGVESLGSSFTANQEVLKNFTIAIPSTVLDNNNLQVAVLVWEKDDADGISNSILVDVL